MIKKLLLLLLLTSQLANSQVRFKELAFGYNDNSAEIVIKNFGNSTVDISSYWISTNLTEAQVNTFQISSGSYILLAGEYIVLEHPGIQRATLNAGFSLFETNNFNSTTDMLDFFQYGSTGNDREFVAISKGIWNPGDYLLNLHSDNSLLGGGYTYDGNGIQNNMQYWSGYGLLNVQEQVFSKAKIHPNPASDNFSIITPNTNTIDQVNIYNINGALIKKMNSDFEKINISNLNQGIYLVEIISGYKKVTKRLIVQ